MGIVTRIVGAIVCAIMVAAIPLAAVADSQTFNAIFFRPATGRNPYLMLHGTQTLHQLQFDVGNYFSYGYRPLDLRVNGQLQNVIQNLVVSDFVAAIGATDWLQFGIDLPVVLINQFADPSASAASGTSNQFNLGDLRLEAKARVLDCCSKPVGLAFVPFMTLPTGNDAHYVGDPGLTGGLRIAVDGRITPHVALTGNVGMVAGRKVKINNVEWQYRMLLGGGVLGTIKPGIDLFGEINAYASFNNLFNDRDMNPVEMMVGARYDIGKSGVTLHGGAGSCLVCGVQGARARAVLGVKYRFLPPKLQAKESQVGNKCLMAALGLTTEQIYFLKENCPANPEEFVQGVNDDACPKFYELRELATLLLRCPPRAEDFNPQVHDQACPKVFTLEENYSPAEIRNIVALSVAQMSLLCPSDPSQFNAQIHDQACPKYYDLKETELLADKCPDPDQYQSGKDDPACPKYYTLLDQYGEIDWKEVERLRNIDLTRYGPGVMGGEIQTMRPVYFDFGRSDLVPQAQSALDEVIRVINQTPWISSVRVSGNADARGTPEANDKISQKRANVVIDYMRQRGVRPDVQLTPVAYGASWPAASNDTEEGRQLNRRVVFTVSSYQIPRYTPKAPGASRPAPAPAAALPPPVSPPAEGAMPPPVSASPAPQGVAPAPGAAPEPGPLDRASPTAPSRWGN